MSLEKALPSSVENSLVLAVFDSDETLISDQPSIVSVCSR